MKLSYYDTLANLVLGYLLLFITMYVFGVEYSKDYSIPYMALGFVFGYFLNAISSLVESLYFWSFRGRPSTILLKYDDEKKYSGICKVRFYEAKKAANLLKKECNNTKADEQEMFSVAMRIAGEGKESRIEAFNAQYAFSRAMLTFVLISSIIMIAKFRCDWRVYATFVPMLVLAWNRCRERGYYFAREVLKEYVNSKKR